MLHSGADLLDTVQCDTETQQPPLAGSDGDDGVVEFDQDATQDAASNNDGTAEDDSGREEDLADVLIVPRNLLGDDISDDSEANPRAQEISERPAIASDDVKAMDISPTDMKDTSTAGEGHEVAARDAVDEVPSTTYFVDCDEQPALQDSIGSEKTSTPVREESEMPAFPPPAPTGLAVVVGSMIPVNTGGDDDEDSDSQDEDEEEEHHVLTPPLNLEEMRDDDDDELEVDSTVADTIEVKKESAKPAKAVVLDGTASQAPESDLLAALPISKPTASSDEIEFSFADEVRAVRVAVSSSSIEEPSKRGGKAPGPQDDSAESAFGISYTSLRKKRDGADSTERDGYSLPTASAFPDEREFENELTLSNDVSLSVKSTTHSTTPVDAIDDGDDDEFGPIAASVGDGAIEPVSPQSLEARRASLQARRTQDEEHIIEELKRATDEEKSLNESERQTPSAAATAAMAPPSTQATESGNALTLRELHGIYKRGLGDQGVLLDENEGNDSNHSRPQHAAASSGSTNSTPLSVMGRILSKPAIMAEAITEEEEGEEEDDEEKGGGAAAGKKIEASSRDAGENHSSHNTDGSQDWTEIQLTHHPPARDTVSRTEGGEVSAKNNSYASQPATNFKISFHEAFEYCLQADVFLQQRDKIVPEDFAETGRSCFACFSPRPRLLFPSAVDERDRVFCIAATSYDACSDVFSRVLQTLYTKLTRTQREVPLSGSHWEDIGFQGNDPATDLRGCGVLSLLQMLYLVEKHAELALRFHSLSQHPTRHFPLACTLINVTLQCVTALRSGALYKECNKQASVFNAINSVRVLFSSGGWCGRWLTLVDTCVALLSTQFYVALASELMDEIQSSPDAIPIVMKEVLDDGRANPDRVLEQFYKSGETGAQSPRKPAGARETNANIAFTEIALQSPSSDEEDE